MGIVVAGNQINRNLSLLQSTASLLKFPAGSNRTGFPIMEISSNHNKVCFPFHCPFKDIFQGGKSGIFEKRFQMRRELTSRADRPSQMEIPGM